MTTTTKSKNINKLDPYQMAQVFNYVRKTHQKIINQLPVEKDSVKMMTFINGHSKTRNDYGKLVIHTNLITNLFGQNRETRIVSSLDYRKHDIMENTFVKVKNNDGFDMLTDRDGDILHDYTNIITFDENDFLNVGGAIDLNS